MGPPLVSGLHAGRRRAGLPQPLRRPKAVAGETGKHWRRLYAERYRIERKRAEQNTRQGSSARYWGAGHCDPPGRGHGYHPNLKRFAELLAPGVWLQAGAA